MENWAKKKMYEILVNEKKKPNEGLLLLNVISNSILCAYTSIFRDEMLASDEQFQHELMQRALLLPPCYFGYVACTNVLYGIKKYKNKLGEMTFKPNVCHTGTNIQLFLAICAIARKEANFENYNVAFAVVYAAASVQGLFSLWFGTKSMYDRNFVLFHETLPQALTKPLTQDNLGKLFLQDRVKSGGQLFAEMSALFQTIISSLVIYEFYGSSSDYLGEFSMSDAGFQMELTIFNFLIWFFFFHNSFCCICKKHEQAKAIIDIQYFNSNSCIACIILLKLL